MDVRTRFNVRLAGLEDGPPLVFAHGFGCDQSMWRRLWPQFAETHRIVLFDYVGSGASELGGYDPERYDTLAAYAEDVVALCHDLDLHDVTFVGHSVSGMIGVLAQLADPALFSRLVMVSPSARYLDDDGYRGGFSPSDIADLLELMDSNHLGWQDPLASMVADGGEHPAAKEELETSFCRIRPDIAAQFAQVTFLGDNRADLAAVAAPTLVLQNRHDAIAPMSAGEYVAEHLPDATLVVLDGRGHVPHLTAPEETASAIRRFLTA